MVARSEAKITIARLRDVFLYDADTGVFSWRASGESAGTADKRYAYLDIDGVRLSAHRAAWAYVKGVWPTHQIDHRDGVKKNNRFTNLRDATPSINQQNQRRAQKHNTTGLLGVVPVRGRFRAQIWCEGAAKNLGTYDTAMDAHSVYLIAKRVLHDGCTL